MSLLHPVGTKSAVLKTLASGKIKIQLEMGESLLYKGMSFQTKSTQILRPKSFGSLAPAFLAL
jgi:hypothetical protein